MDSERFDEVNLENRDARLYMYDKALTKHRTPEHPVLDGFDVMSIAFNVAPFETMAWLRENAPVYWDDNEGLWAISTHEHVSFIEANWEIFSSAFGSRPNSSVPSMINADPPDHTRRRRIVSSGFTPRRVAAHEEFIRTTVTNLIDAVIDTGSCDFVAEIAAPIPLRMIAALMGLPAEDEAKLLAWSDLFATGTEETTDEVIAASFEFAEYIVEIMQTRTDPEAEDLISLLLHTDGEPLSPEDLIFETMLILVGGDETTRHVMSGGLEALLKHPEQFAALKADRSLLPGAIEEMLRWVTPVRNMSRTATQDVELGGQKILEGDRLLLLYLSANRDDAAFDRAGEFDITRTPNQLDRLPEIELANPDIWQPERRGNFVLGLSELPVRWPAASSS